MKLNKLIGFNPYFTGSTTSTILADPKSYIGIEFQSLFYWKYHFNKSDEIEAAGPLYVSILILLEVPLQPS